ncbi:hypothetical protein D3C86_1851190 [compost metagenome]
MGDRSKGGERCGTDSDRRTIRADKLRKAFFDGKVSTLQCIVLGVGDLRRILGVVQFVVMGQLFRQPLQFGSSRMFGQRFDWGLIGGHAGISIFTAFLVQSPWIGRTRSSRRVENAPRS